MRRFRGVVLVTVTVLGSIALAACETTQSQTENAARRWLGQPVRAYAESRSLVPETVYDNPDGTRTFMFRHRAPLGSCGVTMVATPSGNEFVIARVNTTCGAQVF